MSKKERNTAPPLALDGIAGRILLLRGQRVMLDTDLAALFGVPTKRFNAAVRRNLARFPADFMFPLTNQDLAALRSQIATLKTGRRQHRKYPPYAFTEHGAIMAATILISPHAYTSKWKLASFCADMISSKPRLKQIYYALHDRAVSHWKQRSCLTDDNRGARGKELSRSREAFAVQAARREGGVGQGNRGGISVGIAGDLAEHPIHAAGVRQNDGRAQLGRRKIREWETNEND